MFFFDLSDEGSDLESDDTKIVEEPKIIDKVISCDVNKCFKDTKVYKFNQTNNFIKDIDDHEKKEHKRIFYKDNTNVGYIEVFQNPQLAFAYKTSSKISFLFECLDNKKLIIDQKKCFGFRYYNTKNEYCTLLKIGNEDIDEYQFLEKIKDEENCFYDEKLDCFSIVYESIFSKYNKKKDALYSIIKEGPLYDVLGFSHAILFKNNEYFKFHKPHTIDILDIKDFTNSTPISKKEKILNIQPLLFEGHISILFFFDKAGKRGFI